jgi:hypothetical protein
MLCLLLTLLVTPISYSIFDDWGAKLPKLFGRRQPKAKSGEMLNEAVPAK